MHILSMEVSLQFGKDSQFGIYFTAAIDCPSTVSENIRFRTLCAPIADTQKQISRQVPQVISSIFGSKLEKINPFFINSCIFERFVVEWLCAR